MELNEAARAAFNAMREGITIIDTDGIIVFGNTAYREFLNKEAGGDIGPIEGYRLRDLRPGARLPDVLEKGEPILHLTRQEVEDFYFVNLYPIYRDGVLLGGLSVVTFLDDAYRAREELEAMEADGRMALLPKKEQILLRKELSKLQLNLNGIRNMKRVPDAIFVIDTNREEIAIREAHRLNIPVVGTLDTNCDPDDVEYGIPANDDAIRSVKLLADFIADAVVAGTGAPVSAEEMAAPAEAEAAPAAEAAAPAAE